MRACLRVHVNTCADARVCMFVCTHVRGCTCPRVCVCVSECVLIHSTNVKFAVAHVCVGKEETQQYLFIIIIISGSVSVLCKLIMKGKIHWAILAAF